MNINETNQMKERIDGVLETAKKFGTQAEQLNSTRMTVSEFVKQAQATSQQLSDLTSRIGKMIDETEELLNGRISAQIEPEIDRVHTVIDECRTHISKTTNQYQDAIKQLEASKDIFAEQHQKAEELLDKTVSDVSSALDKMTLTLDSEMQELNDKLSETISKNAEENSRELKKIQSACEDLAASIEELKERHKKETEETKTLLKDSSKKQTIITIVGFVVTIGLILALHFLK